MLRSGDFTFKFQGVPGEKTYDQSQLETAEKIAFYAGRRLLQQSDLEFNHGFPTGAKYKSFEDYKPFH